MISITNLLLKIFSIGTNHLDKLNFYSVLQKVKEVTGAQKESLWLWDFKDP